MTLVLTDYCMCKTNALWFSPEAAQRKIQEKKQTTQRKQKKEKTHTILLYKLKMASFMETIVLWVQKSAPPTHKKV